MARVGLSVVPDLPHHVTWARQGASPRARRAAAFSAGTTRRRSAVSAAAAA